MRPFLTLFAVLLSASTALLHAQPAKLNVLFIEVDDLNDWVGVFGGHPQAKTPNMDRLANQAGGTVFMQAYCPGSVCCASRSAMLTGLRPSTTGVYGNSNNLKASPIAAKAVTLPQYFSQHGYHSLSSGKIFHKHPSWIGMDEGQWAFDEWERNSGGDGLDKANLPLNKLPMLDGQKPNAESREFDWGPTVTATKQTSDYLTCAWAAKQLDRDFSDKPFFMAVGISKPHLPFHVPQEFFDMHPLDQVHVPEIVPDDLDDILTPRGKKKFGPTEDFLRVQKANQFKQVTQGYLAACSYADHCIGVVLDKLAKSRYAENTIVIVCGDHGWFLGEKLRYRKTELWQESTRVPLIIRVPGLSEQGVKSNRIANLLDLYPTLVELCGLPPKEGLDGRSFAGWQTAPSEPGLPTLTTMGYRNHSVRSATHRYTRYADGTEELYDHQTDPMEHRNLITAAELNPVVDELRAYLPKQDEPEAVENEIDKKRLRKTMAQIRQMGKEYSEKAERGQIDPELIRKVYDSLK